MNNESPLEKFNASMKGMTKEMMDHMREMNSEDIETESQAFTNQFTMGQQCIRVSNILTSLIDTLQGFESLAKHNRKATEKKDKKNEDFEDFHDLMDNLLK